MNAKKTCLFIDDSSVIREIATRIITDLGLNTAEAGDSKSAIKYCREENPAVVFLDWDLPSMGALDFLRSAASLDEKPTIILCATENDHQQFALAKAAGAAHHILKPFDKAGLAAKLREIGLIEGEDQPMAANQ